MIEKWKTEWKELFINSVSKLPKDITLSFSGGFDSSIILFALLEMGRKPNHCITFRFDNYESKDYFYTKKACDIYDIPLIVADIPRKSRIDLLLDCKAAISRLGNSRQIDVQAATIFDYMLPLVPTKDLVVGFFDNSLYKSGSKESIQYSRYKKGLIGKEEFEGFYKEIRRSIFEDKHHNHHILMDYIRKYNIEPHAPLFDRNLFEFSQNLGYNDFHYSDENKYWTKYFLYELWKPFFDKVGNMKNKNNMHVVSKIKEYHEQTLLPETKHKKTVAIYNRLKKELGNDGNGKLLIQCLYDSSTNNYPRYFPMPLNLMEFYNPDNGDKIIDYNLKAFKRNKAEKLKIANEIIGVISDESKNFEEVIINCGEYAPDGAFYEWYEYVLDRIKVPVSLTGSYPTIFKDRIKKRYSARVNFLESKSNVQNVHKLSSLIESYPTVGSKKKINLRLSAGCPRTCRMCPVSIIHNGKYIFFDVRNSIETIKKLYKEGIRFFNFIDDNISASPRFLSFLRALREENLKGTVFQAQEGFEVKTFHSEEVCKLLKDNKFVDIKVGIENIKPGFLNAINKDHNGEEDVTIALGNIKNFGLSVKAYLLIGLNNTYQDVIENLRFLSIHKLPVRVNIIRLYEGAELSDNSEPILSMKELRSLKSLANAISWLNQTHKIDYFSDQALNAMKRKFELTFKKRNSIITIKGKVFHGFQTSQFSKIIKFLLENYTGKELKKISDSKDKLMFRFC